MYIFPAHSSRLLLPWKKCAQRMTANTTLTMLLLLQCMTDVIHTPGREQILTLTLTLTLAVSAGRVYSHYVSGLA